jgi:histidinol-phosphate aminotransferase
VGLDRNERLAPLPDWFLAELRERLTSELASTYPSPPALREELAASLGVSTESVLVTPGTDAALRAVHLAYVRPGDAIVRLDPTYAMLPVYAQMFAARDIAIGYDEHLQLATDSLLAAVTPGVRLVVIANPNQPTGTRLSGDLLEELVAGCERAGALLVLDEAYHAFSGETGLPFVERSGNVLVLRTFSKAAGLAGLRVGFAVGAPPAIRALASVRSAGEVNALALEAARLIVAHPEVVSDYAALVEEGRIVLDRRARELGVEPLPTHANFVLLRLPDGHEPADVVERLRARGYIVRGPFTAECLHGCIRATLGPPDLMERFSDALASSLGAER